ncbi:hypothetical protein V5799_011075 [Amblyomma americanum]|uniref:SPT2 homolog N-terminal domain-containing protein n=1 Tax=Amblyomma americanum TaxID=6943 RepID=A0AAQ4EI53_AMBAM
MRMQTTVKRYSTEVAPAKKAPRTNVQSAAIRAFLQRKEEEERRKLRCLTCSYAGAYICHGAGKNDSLRQNCAEQLAHLFMCHPGSVKKVFSHVYLFDYSTFPCLPAVHTSFKNKNSTFCLATVLAMSCSAVKRR